MFKNTSSLDESPAKDQLSRTKVSSIICHVIELSYAAFYDKHIHEEKVADCNGCAINHPSQRQHTCIMLDNKEAWDYYHKEARVKIDLSTVKETIESVCSDLGFTLAEQSWESFLNALPNHSWESIYLTSLGLEHYGQDIKNRVLNTLYNGAQRLEIY